MNDLISRQQAVDAICKEWCCCSHDDCKNKAMMEAGFDPCDGCSDVGAIMELPSVQPETHDKSTETHACDLISRQAAIDMVHKEFDECLVWDESGERTADEVENILRTLPPAQPERKTGKWIEVNDAYSRISGRCSVCGWESHLYEDDVVGMDYCPNCGARLEVE